MCLEEVSLLTIKGKHDLVITKKEVGAKVDIVDIIILTVPIHMKHCEFSAGQALIVAFNLLQDTIRMCPMGTTG